MSEPVRRADDIEEFTNRLFIQPLSSMLVPWFVRLRMSANMVSILGMLCGVSAAWFYFRAGQGLSWSLGGLALMLLWHVLDGADGQVARLTNTQSEFGKVIDGICDYVVFISVYLAIGAAAAPQEGAWVWLLILAAGIAHAVQASAYETQRQLFDFWALGKKSAELPGIAAQPGRGITGWLAHGYSRMQFRVSGLTAAFLRAPYDHAARDPGDLPRFRADYRKTFAPTVHLWSILCANYRTFGLFIACAAGRPLLFFWWELVVLAVLHGLLAVAQRRWNATFYGRLPSRVT